MLDKIESPTYMNAMAKYTLTGLIVIFLGVFTSGCTTLEVSDIEFKSIAGIQRRDTTMSALPELNSPKKGKESQLVIEFESGNFKNSVAWRPLAFKCGEVRKSAAMAVDSTIHSIGDKTYRFYFKESYSAHGAEGASKLDPNNLCFRLQDSSGTLTVGVSNIVKVPSDKADEAFRSLAP